MNKRGKKILCVCRWGNIRSVALARMLKKEGFDALSSGVYAQSPETLDMLCQWADIVLVVTQELLDSLPEEYKTKYHNVQIGEDIWKDADHPDLLRLIKRQYYALKPYLYGATN